ncbi:MAG: orotate phosphoribosyltransferase [Pseudomonadota bacterium]
MSETEADMRARLIALIAERSYGTGVQIKLASGRTSDFYFNLKPTMLHPEGAALIGKLMAPRVKAAGANYVGGLEMGAVPVATAIAAASHHLGQPLPAFFIRKQAKEHGTQADVEGLVKGETIAGRSVVVVEDVTTTGGSALKAVDVLKAAGADIKAVMTIVDREEGAAETFANAGLTFTPLLTRKDFV